MACGCFGLIKNRMPGEKQEVVVQGLRLFVFVGVHIEKVMLKVTETLDIQGNWTL